MMRSVVLTFRLCPFCGLPAAASVCSCGAVKTDRGWSNGDVRQEVDEAIALLKSLVKLLPRQSNENAVEWLKRVMELVGQAHLSIEGDG